MKHNYFILAAIAFVIGLAFAGCKKQEQEALTPKITNDKVETTATTATFTWTVDWLGKLISMVEVSENEDMSHSQIYGSETETDNHNFTVTVTDLKVATKYYYRYLVWNHHYVDNKFEFEVKSFSTQTDLPKVKTVEVTDVTRTTATVIGEVINECGAEVTERGVCWSTNHNPTTSGSHLSSGTGLGTYSIALSNLEVGKTYYVRAYAKNSKGTAYGDELDFVTGDAVKPTVTTADITNIDWRTATGGGEVTDDGDATVTERGICWSTSHNPEVSGDHANNGTGTGNYTVNMTGLTAGTTCYVRAYAKNIAGLNYGNEVIFEAKAPELPMVITNTVTEITYTTAIGRGEVTSDGGVEVTECGICWGTNHNPDISNDFMHLAASSAGMGGFTCSLTALNPETKYYVRAYATNSEGTSYGEEKEFTTQALQKPTVTTASVSQFNFINATAVGGGEVTSDGGDPVTERGIYYGTTPNPATTGTKLEASSTGIGSFTCTMTGLVEGTTFYVCAYATNGQGTSYGSERSFSYNPPPTGAINGIFSVSSSKKVYFSQGNLQYIGSAGTPYWKFAEHQWDYLGDNGQGSTNQNVDRDLFGWGTSGWNCGSTYYRPWDTNFSEGLGGGEYGPPEGNNLTGNYAKSDWGYNAISNGGNTTNMWRTLTKDEWVYVLNTRSTASGIRYAKAQVNSVKGLILLPDDWRTSYYNLSSTNTNDAWWGSNTISASQWATLEQHGAVFLPAAGQRTGTLVGYVNSVGEYWSASYYNRVYAYTVGLFSNDVNSSGRYDRYIGVSVRLVAPVEN